MSNLQQQLEKFRVNYYSARVIVHDDMLVYAIKVPSKNFLKVATNQANDLIKHLDLDLEAIAYKGSLTTFIVKQKANENNQFN